LKKLNIEKERISKEKDIFFASVSHELRNPLNSLIGCIDLLTESAQNYNHNKINQAEILQTAKICGETLLNLIGIYFNVFLFCLGNVLDVSKIEANKLTLNEESADIMNTIKKVVQMCETIAKNKGIFMKLKQSKTIPSLLRYDHSRLMQILINLISNAIKFTDKGGVFAKIDYFPLPFHVKKEQEKIIMKSLLNHSHREELVETVEGKKTKKKQRTLLEMDSEELPKFNPTKFENYQKAPHSSNSKAKKKRKSHNS
jgi:signal transduction histidine kinase